MEIPLQERPGVSSSKTRTTHRPAMYSDYVERFSIAQELLLKQTLWLLFN